MGRNFICSKNLKFDIFTLKVHDTLPSNPCNPSPCGANAVCLERNGAGSCSCMPNYFGNPYISCKPECIQNSDCPYDKSCINTKCIDPCSIGACGLNAECRVSYHTPMCHCIAGYTGNPSSKCYINREYIPPANKPAPSKTHSYTYIKT